MSDLIRLDQLLVQQGHFITRERAQAAILAGEVWSQGQRQDKAGTKFRSDKTFEVQSRSLQYVSRAGYKLSHALDVFEVSPTGLTCIDVGASTGGFTDCLLQRGAKQVFSVDSGYGQLDFKLRNHPQVKSLERTNARYLTRTDLGESRLDLACFDVSFISLHKVVAPIAQEFSEISTWIFLFKPQFEVGPENLKKGGIVKNEQVTREALAEFKSFMQTLHLEQKGEAIASPILGKKSGNQEYLLCYVSPSLHRPSSV